MNRPESKQPEHRLSQGCMFVRTFSYLVVAGTLIFASAAAAQATVDVQVTGATDAPVDGKVSLTSTGTEARSYGCTTSGGKCTINDVIGGSYSMAFTAAGSKNKTVRKVMIPPSGRVTLKVSAK